MSPRESVRCGGSCLRPPRVDPLLGFRLPTVFTSFEGRTDFAAHPSARFATPDSQEFPPKSPARQRPEVSLLERGSLRLSTPLDRYEVSRPRLSSSLGARPALAYVFASSLR
jgi:hypothetical protein